MQTAPAIFPVSIVIPSYNRPAILQDTIAQVLRQPFRNYELWVVDQSVPDDAQANAKYVEELGDPRVHYLHLSRNGLPNARNEALVRARGEIVLFLDDDVILLAEDFIGAHLRAYEDTTVGGVVGRHVERSLRINSRHTACHVSWSGRTIFNLFGTEKVEVRSCKGSNMSFRMAVVNEVGGFDRRTQMLEETDYSTRVRAAGWHIIFEPAAEVVHLSSPAGGVRRQNKLQQECRRFESTAYYIGKHRGFVGAATFVATFTLIACARAVRFRSISAVPVLYKALFKGFAEARKGPDQSLPEMPVLQHA
jgi:GT2 family glycosyltransferase